MERSFNNAPKTGPYLPSQHRQDTKNQIIQPHQISPASTSIHQSYSNQSLSVHEQRNLQDRQIRESQPLWREEAQNKSIQNFHSQHVCSQLENHFLHRALDAKITIPQMTNQYSTNSSLSNPSGFDTLSSNSHQNNEYKNKNNPYNHSLCQDLDIQYSISQPRNQFSRVDIPRGSSSLDRDPSISQISQYPKFKPTAEQKMYNPVVPADDSTLNNFAPIRQIPLRLKATLVQKFLESTPPTEEDKKIVRGASQFVGEVVFKGQRRGGCFQISPELVILPRHIIQGDSIFLFEIIFFGASTKSGVLYAIEEDAQLDYAIVQLKSRRLENANFLPFSTDIETEELLLLHYPQESSLSVSSHAIKLKNYNEVMLETYHDTTYESSGGVYLNSNGEIVAIHLGCLPSFDKMNIGRYGSTLKGIKEERPESILNQDYLSQGFRGEDIYYFLVEEDSWFDLEGKKFANLMKDYENSGLTEAQAEEEAIKFAKQHGGRYGSMLYLFSHSGKIQSDHFPPKVAYRSSPNQMIKRMKESQMAVLVLEHQDHRDFDTTTSKRVRERMKDYFKAENYYGAIKYNLKLYKNKNLIYPGNKNGIKDALQVHVENGLLTNLQKSLLIIKFHL